MNDDDDVRDNNTGGASEEGSAVTGPRSGDKGYAQVGVSSTPIHTPIKSTPTSTTNTTQSKTMTQGSGGEAQLSQQGQLKTLGNIPDTRVVKDHMRHVPEEPSSSSSDKSPLHGVAWFMEAIGLSTLYLHNPIMTSMSMMVVVWMLVNRPLALLFFVLPMVVYWWLA